MKEIINPYGFIYITTNVINGKKYIGQKMFNCVRGGWKKYLGSGTNIKRAIDKYGEQNFSRDIVAIAYSKDELNVLEVEWINNYNAVKSANFYNIADGGDVSNKFAGKTDEEMQIIIEKIRSKNKGKKVSLETRERMRKSHPDTSGTNNPMYGRFGEDHPMYGKHHSNETKKKLSESHKGKLASKETKEKMSKARIGLLSGEKNPVYGKVSPNAKKVRCITTGMIFNSALEASCFYKCNNSHICGCCNGSRNFCGKLDNGTKLQWEHFENELKKEVIYL